MTHSEIETRGIPTGNGSRPRIQAAIDAQCHTIFVRNACIGCIQRCPLRQVVDVANRHLVCSTLVCIVAGNMAVGDRDISGAQGDARTERVVGCLRATRQCGNGQTGLVNTPLAHDLGNPEVVGSPQIGLREVIGRSILGHAGPKSDIERPTAIANARPDVTAIRRSGSAAGVFSHCVHHLAVQALACGHCTTRRKVTHAVGGAKYRRRASLYRHGSYANTYLKGVVLQ